MPRTSETGARETCFGPAFASAPASSFENSANSGTAVHARALLLASVVLIGCKAAETPEQMAAREQAAADSAKTAIMVGKYLAHLHKTDAGWRIAENIWNTDAPAPRAPPTR